MHTKVRQLLLLAATLSLSAALTGCPGDQAPAASTAPNQTAPTLPVAQQQGTPRAGVAPVTQPGAQQQQQLSPAAKLPQDPAFIAARDQQLINKAEQAYKSGVTNYRAQRLDAARIDFDFAVDLMLTSGYDLKGDPQLADEFQHLLDAVNALELDALKQGNGLSPKLEEAPLDAAAELTFPANAKLTAELKTELQFTKSDFPLVVNDYVAGWITYFTSSPGGHAHLLRSLERSGKYRDMIARALADQHVPQDLIYLAVAESGFQPQALNARSGAGGMWQFMPQGGYGLARNGYFDERFDPEKSSIAYAKYMRTLYDQFGDWYLAMAAYDWGPGNVQRAVMRTGYADYWELYRRNALPQETKNYVPGIIAAIIMAKNPEKYGLQNYVADSPVVSDTISTSYAIDLRLVADLTNATLPEIVALNPSLLRMSTPGDLNFDLHIPVGTKETFEKRIKLIPEARRTSWRFHEVRAGESLDIVASNLHVHPSDIAAANGLAAGEAIETGDELVIPVATAASASSHPQRYTVRRGDSLVTVADRFNVSVEELRKWNNLSSNSVSAGRSLNVAEPVRLAPSVHSRVRTSRRERASKSAHGRTSSHSNSKASTSTHAAPAKKSTASAGKRKRR